ncbi:MAG: hypothetical protein HC845_06480 [Akkermansiaceae bacterium]|nr:hypothetical protein [Akkermansiaceae bacterium]
MEEKKQIFELLEPQSPESLVPDSWIEPWMIILSVLFALAVLAIFIFKKKKKAAFDPEAIRRAAHLEACQAFAKISETTVRETAVQVSIILRKYLSVVASDPALFETHEETISRHEALENFTEPARESAKNLFSHLASLKYAKKIPDAKASRIIDDGTHLLGILHHGFMK